MVFGGKIWRSSREAGGNWEINICAEYLSRSIQETAGTLLHEMAHLYNAQRDIDDCNSNQYHNSHFKDAAEMAGLIVERSAPYGWALTRPAPETESWINTLNVDEKAFSVFRVVIMPEQPVPPSSGGRSPRDDDNTTPPERIPTPIRKPTPTALPPRQTRKGGSKMKKWFCGCTIVRCAVELNATCGRCGRKFEKAE
ncbi:MAG: hypothetical protein JL50_08685 [Peptococcaceae bacterium BICA1-7]|nr:MAG: hypothetical protein JL50_08685 [Peptococcaceae bacterium BICA1-7]HBV97360.1 hypothetical protein [Desulfotomaculum sp.]